MHQNNLIPGDAVAVTPSDSTYVNFVGIYVGVTGDVSVTPEGGTAVVFTAAPAGAIIPLRIVKVNSTSTTATNIVGFKA